MVALEAALARARITASAELLTEVQSEASALGLHRFTLETQAIFESISPEGRRWLEGTLGGKASQGVEPETPRARSNV